MNRLKRKNERRIDMRKIMFNDEYGLTEAVLKGRKTMTRRIISNKQAIYSLDDMKQLAVSDNFIKKYSRFQVGEEVAVAQRYKHIYCHEPHQRLIRKEGLTYTKGWNNKMFVLADLMPHRIRITNIKVEKLQDISDEDCLREGIYDTMSKRIHHYRYLNSPRNYINPCEAFASLIDKVSGNGTWERNPWIFAYSFELIK